MKMTLWGINQYMDGTLLDFLPESLPADTFDPQIMEDLIYIQCGDLFPYYQVPNYLKLQIKNFFDRNAEQFKRVWEALYSEYNPIENYDRIEAWSDSHSESTRDSESVHTSESARNSESLSTSSSESVSAITSSSSSESSSARGDVSAFNASTLQPQSASSGSAATGGTTNNDTRGTSNSLRAGLNVQDTINYKNLLNTRDNKALDEHRGRVHGNIGVTTSQQMIQSSIELGSYDIYLWVITLFQKNIISAIV